MSAEQAVDLLPVTLTCIMVNGRVETGRVPFIDL